ncbi:hypothetical protein BHM03_00028286, partial [Ensete ventricosum]
MDHSGIVNLARKPSSSSLECHRQSTWSSPAVSGVAGRLPGVSCPRCLLFFLHLHDK